MSLQTAVAAPTGSSDLPLEAADISANDLDWHKDGEREQCPGDQWRQWLFDPGSLTQLLKQKSAGDFAVKLIAEEWVDLPKPAIRGQFGPLDRGHQFWSRKVLLKGQGEPWVLAHTLIPRYSLLGPLQSVLELNEQPLGEYLFSHPELVRSAMDISSFAGESWGRRSLFYLFQKPIMVAEFFLPGILD